MGEPKTHTLEAPGAVLHYDVRDHRGARHPVLLLIGAPMGASGFAALAGQFADRVVVGVGTQSGEMMAGRAAAAVAERLGATPITFPGGHDGFRSDPDTFAAVLRTALDGGS